MTENNIDYNDWKRLYDAADKIREIAPWEYLYEDQVFCVEIPETRVLCFVSIMGALGEHYSISVYTGIDEYRKFAEFKNGDPMSNPEKLMEINQIMLSYENKSGLEKEDIAVSKALGLSYSGRRRWPMFRNFKDGFLPWFLEPEDVKILTVVLEQGLEIITRLKSRFSLPEPENNLFLVKYAEKKNGMLIWEEKVMKIAYPGFIFKVPEADEILVRRINAFPLTNRTFEFDYLLLLKPIQESKSVRPYYATMALLMDHGSGMILGSELFGMKSNYLQRMELVPAVLLKLLARQKMRPQKINIMQPGLYEILKRILGNVDIQIHLTAKLPKIEEARAELREFN